MANVNEHFLALPPSYLFSDIARRVSEYQSAHPGQKLIRMGIGDVTQPLPEAATAAMHRAVDDLTRRETFHGYGPEQGYDFLLNAICEHDFRARGIQVAPDEIFVSDGAKSDTGNFGDILSVGNCVAVADPVYPVYVDSNVMAGRAGNLLPDGRWDGITYLPCTTENGFKPTPPAERVDMVYLCSPNNPTGVALTRADLSAWVDYARRNEVLILFDAAYEAFVRHEDVPHSIYEIPGAEECAVEFRSFSKTAGFTGVRCGYVVVPKAVKARTTDGRTVALNPLWNRRQCTKFNGASYITQRGAAAIYTPEGQIQVARLIDYYLANARLILDWTAKAGLEAYGGEDSPYVWLRTPAGSGSWDFFDRLLHEAGVVCTPGVGFGPCGEGYVRLTAFNTREATAEAMERLSVLSL